MRRGGWILVTLMASGCGTVAMDLQTGPSETDELAAAENLLGQRVRELFGAQARIRQVYGPQSRQVVAVGLEALVEESDALPPVALGTFDALSNTLEVLEPEASFREARWVGDTAALLHADGELRLRTSGGDMVLAQQVRGDLAPTPDGRALALTLVGPVGDEERTAVAVVDLTGSLQVLADSEGLNDRPAVSPDGRTVVFVSGRTGIASLFRTSLEGEPAVQLTNLGIELGVERDGDPEGFVPPPVNGTRIEWMDADVLRYDAGAGDYWQVNVRTSQATREGGAL